MQIFLRNFLIPFIFVFGFAAAGFTIIGSEEFDVVVTADGVPVKGALAEENAAQMTETGVEIASHVVLYGVKLPGDSRLWQFATVFVFSFIGYRIGNAFKIKRRHRRRRKTF